MSLKRKSRGRQKFLSLATVNTTNVPDNISREEWLEEVSQGFVSPSEANKSYYRVLLEELWPPGHGIPGPLIREDQLREAVDRFRRNQHTASTPYKPYVDVFRRLRELQGEEGVTGIGRSGKTYQLVSLTLSEKRVPRIKSPPTSKRPEMAECYKKWVSCTENLNTGTGSLSSEQKNGHLFEFHLHDEPHRLVLPLSESDTGETGPKPLGLTRVLAPSCSPAAAPGQILPENRERLPYNFAIGCLS